MKCFLCDYEGNMEIKSSVEGRDIVKCPNCSVQFMRPQTSDKELNEIYSNKNYPTCSFDKGSENEIIKMKRKTFKSILKKILPYCNSGNILDIGCSSGILLEEARNLGFNPYGVEISEYASSIAKKRICEDKIHNGSLENIMFEKNYFSLITMIDVIEHVRNPIEILSKSSEYLNITTNSNGGGYCMITTPNTDSFSAKIMGKKWLHYNNEHLNYFNIKSMRELSKRTGFKIVKYGSLLKTMRLEYVYFQMKEHNRKFLSNFIKNINNAPLISKIDFPIFSGDFYLILKKI